MALVKETGAIVENADTFATLKEIRDFALKRGTELSDDDDILTGYAIRAMDYLRSLESEYVGARVSAVQALPWPRKTAIDAHGNRLSETAVPVAIADAQAALVMALSAGVDPMADRAGGAVLKRSTVGPITEEFDTSQGVAGPRMPLVDALLSPLLRRTALGPIKVIRV